CGWTGRGRDRSLAWSAGPLRESRRRRRSCRCGAPRAPRRRTARDSPPVVLTDAKSLSFTEQEGDRRSAAIPLGLYVRRWVRWTRGWRPSVAHCARILGRPCHWHAEGLQSIRVQVDELAVQKTSHSACVQAVQSGGTNLGRQKDWFPLAHVYKHSTAQIRLPNMSIHAAGAVHVPQLPPQPSSPQLLPAQFGVQPIVVVVVEVA